MRFASHCLWRPILMHGVHTRWFRRQGDDRPPTRVMVFAAGADQAQRLAGPLRTVLWGEHKIAVLLPQGEEPIQVCGGRALECHSH